MRQARPAQRRHLVRVQFAVGGREHLRHHLMIQPPMAMQGRDDVVQRELPGAGPLALETILLQRPAGGQGQGAVTDLHAVNEVARNQAELGPIRTGGATLSLPQENTFRWREALRHETEYTCARCRVTWTSRHLALAAQAESVTLQTRLVAVAGRAETSTVVAVSGGSSTTIIISTGRRSHFSKWAERRINNSTR